VNAPRCHLCGATDCLVRGKQDPATFWCAAGVRARCNRGARRRLGVPAGIAWKLYAAERFVSGGGR
jgi:hypothetical protein